MLPKPARILSKSSTSTVALEQRPTGRFVSSSTVLLCCKGRAVPALDSSVLWERRLSPTRKHYTTIDADAMFRNDAVENILI